MAKNNANDVLSAEFEFIKMMENNKELMDVLVPEIEDTLINSIHWDFVIPYLIMHYKWKKEREKENENE